MARSMLGGLQCDCLLLLLFPQLILKKKPPSNRKPEISAVLSRVRCACNCCIPLVLSPCLTPPQGSSWSSRRRSSPKCRAPRGPAGAGSSSTPWSTTRPWWAPGSTSSSRRPRALWTEASTTAASRRRAQRRKWPRKPRRAPTTEAWMEPPKRRKCLCPNSLLTWGALSQISALTVHRHMYGCLISLEIVCPLSCFSCPLPPPLGVYVLGRQSDGNSHVAVAS